MGVLSNFKKNGKAGYSSVCWGNTNRMVSKSSNSSVNSMLSPDGVVLVGCCGAMGVWGCGWGRGSG